MNAPPFPPINPGRDYMREHLDELNREVAALRAMVTRQRDRIGDRYADVHSLSAVNVPERDG